MADRSSIIDKVKARVSKTTANGCTEQEMFSALAKARALQDAYDISDDELQLSREEKAVLHDESEANAPDSHRSNGTCLTASLDSALCGYFVIAESPD